MKKHLITILLAVIALLGGSVATTNLGNVSPNEAMNSTTTTSSWAGTKNQIKSSSGILGSVIISSTTPAVGAGAVLILKDATSTTDVSSTTIGTVGFSSSPIVIPFNRAFSRGLIAEAGVGFNGVYTITSK